MRVIGREPARTDQEFDEAGALALRGPSPGAAQEVAFGEDPLQITGGIDDRQAADLVLQHQLYRLQHRTRRAQSTRPPESSHPIAFIRDSQTLFAEQAHDQILAPPVH